MVRHFLIMPIDHVFIMWCVLACFAGLRGADASLTKQFMVDFVNTYETQDYECATESSHMAFTHAKITLAGPSISPHSSFFVTVSSSFPHELCTQYGGGEYEHDDCERTSQAHTSLSMEGLVVTIPLDSHQQQHHEADFTSSSWTICVGNGYDGDTASSIWQAAGSVILSTSSNYQTTERPENHQNEEVKKFPNIQETEEVLLSLAYEDRNIAEELEASNPTLPVPIDDQKQLEMNSFDHLVQAKAAPSSCPSVASYADGYCDSENNIADCDYDGGDCCFEDCTPSDCLDDLLNYPKLCHKDETLIVNYLEEHNLPSNEYCAPNYDVGSGGTWCSLRTAVEFCQSNVVGDQRCIVQLPEGTVQLNLGQIELNDNGRSLVIRGNSSATSVVQNTGGGGDFSRFLYLDFNSNHTSVTEFILEHVTVTDFNTTGGGGGAVYCAYLKTGAFSHVIFLNNHSPKSGGGLYLEGVENVIFSDLTFDSNSCGGEGGGMCVASEANMSATFTNLLFTANSAGEAGGKLT